MTKNTEAKPGEPITMSGVCDEVHIHYDAFGDRRLVTDIRGSEEFAIVPEYPTGESTLVETTVEQIARATHEANRAYCQMLGDDSHVRWEEAPQWQRDPVLDGVRSILSGKTTTPEEQHIAWMRYKEADGWVWGPTKDAEAKTHPCMLNYDQLPIEQRTKDIIFRAVVHALRGI